MDDIYQENILDHAEHPRNFGEIKPSDISAEDSNPLCGDKIGMDLIVSNNVVSDVKFHGHGCSISMAGASMLTEMIKDKNLDELRNIKKDDLLNEMGISLGPVRIKCALLSLKVLKKGLYGLSEEP